MHSPVEQAREIVERFPRMPLFQTPSPVARLRRLESHLDAKVEIYIKRDDLLRPLFGNKIRYLEYILGAYGEADADCIVHAGGITSNYEAQIAMMGAAYGIPVYIILRDDMPEVLQGNPLIEELFGATVRYVPNPEMTTNSGEKQKLADELRKQQLRPYVIDYPSVNYHSHLGYMRCFLEIRQQIADNVLPDIDMICLCSGWHSYLGLHTAAALSEVDVHIVAIRASHWEGSALAKIKENMNDFLADKIKEFESFLGISIPERPFEVCRNYVGSGYGTPTEKSLASVALLARTEGILLDPIYSGKAFAGLLDLIQRGSVEAGTRVLFIHTGGWINVFTYNRELTQWLRSRR